jgi:hypothetical protein
MSRFLVLRSQPPEASAMLNKTEVMFIVSDNFLEIEITDDQQLTKAKRQYVPLGKV